LLYRKNIYDIINLYNQDEILYIAQIGVAYQLISLQIFFTIPGPS